MKHDRATLYLPAAIQDAAGIAARPGAVLVRDGRIVAAGRPDELPAGLTAAAKRIELPDRLLLPAMVNAHAHLDLTDLGPRPYDGDFTGWLKTVAAGRPATPAQLDAAVGRGAAMSRAAGVGWIADLAYHPDAITARLRSGMPGISYLEVFGLGGRQKARIDELHQRLARLSGHTPVAGHEKGIVVGISPHAPYTAGLDILAAATELGRTRGYPLCIHAAETLEELSFLRDGSGMYADHARHYQCTDDDIAAAVTGRHSLDHLEPYLKLTRWLLAHCNYVDDRHLDLLVRTGTSVVYCPIASDYFGHRGHRYRDMLAAGVNVCLGTDSIVCQPPDQAQPMSMLAQMRHLYRRDGFDAVALLAMATTAGLRAMGFDPREATLRAGAPATFGAVRIDPGDITDPLVQTLSNDEPIAPIR